MTRTEGWKLAVTSFVLFIVFVLFLYLFLPPLIVVSFPWLVLHLNYCVSLTLYTYYGTTFCIRNVSAIIAAFNHANVSPFGTIPNLQRRI